jgi:hypothetical protein
MEILVLKFNLSELPSLDISSYLSKNYPGKTFVRGFIFSLYFDTFLLEVLFL